MPSFVIFLCYLPAERFKARLRDYDANNGMWGETDDKKTWTFQPGFTKVVPLKLSNIPKAHALAFS